MTGAVAASAPGKLVLSGEYAVLDGAPAICMAVDRRARVTVTPSGDDCHSVIAPGFSAATGRFRAAGGELEWLSEGGDFGIVEALWQTAAPSGHPPLAITLDTREFGSGDRKIGIGSSAALVVALSHAICRVASTDAEPLPVAFAAHRHLQGGLGSGVDVACSATGGLIGYSMAGTRIEHLRWPDGLAYGVISVGVGSSTRRKLEQLRQRPGRESRTALVESAGRLAAAWRDASADELLAVCRGYVDVLRAFSDDHELGIFDAGHAELVDAARRREIVYKPCGAGGGDTGIVMAAAAAAAAVDDFLEEAVNLGGEPLDLCLDERGVDLEENAS